LTLLEVVSILRWLHPGPPRLRPAVALRPLFGGAVRHFLALADLTPGELRGLIDLAEELRHPGDSSARAHLLAGQSLAMGFAKPSLRTRVSFEVAMGHLGGAAIYLSPAEIGLGSREAPKDVARVLSRYVNGIMARVFGHETVAELAANASVPVINGLSDLYHPCQALADLLTIRREMGRLKGIRLAYIGDGNNVAHSLLIGGSMAGMDVVVIHPPGFAPREDVVDRGRRLASSTGGRVATTTDVEAVAGADVVYTDVWASMGQEEQAQDRRRIFAPYRVDAALVARASPGAIVLHCLPAHRGDEITDEVLDGPQSRVFDQAENRMHAQRALLAWLLGGWSLKQLTAA